MAGSGSNSIFEWVSMRLAAIRANMMVSGWKLHNWLTRLRFKYPTAIELTLWTTALVAIFFVTDQFLGDICRIFSK